MFEQTNETGPSQESIDILQPLILITSPVFSFVSFGYKKLSGYLNKLQKNYWFNLMIGILLSKVS